MSGYDVDLRDLPGYFWVGLGLEVVGGATIVASGPLAGKIAGMCVFATGFALAATAFLFRREREESDEGATGAAGEGKPRKGARALGAFLIAAGVFGAVASVWGGGGRFEGSAMAVIAIGLGVMYLRDAGLPSRRYTATGPESPSAMRLAVHVKHFIAMGICAVLVVVGALFRPAMDAATADLLWWWVFMGVAVYASVYHTGKYIWHCWIKQDYEEPRFGPW